MVLNVSHLDLEETAVDALQDIRAIVKLTICIRGTKASTLGETKLGQSCVDALTHERDVPVVAHKLVLKQHINVL